MSGRKPLNWPSGVEQISLEDLGRLGINQHDQLFWDGRRIEVRQSLVLTGFQKGIAALAALCAVLGALGGFVTGVNNASIFLCARGNDWLSCPVPQASVSRPGTAPPDAPSAEQR